MKGRETEQRKTERERERFVCRIDYTISAGFFLISLPLKAQTNTYPEMLQLWSLSKFPLRKYKKSPTLSLSAICEWRSLILVILLSLSLSIFVQLWIVWLPREKRWEAKKFAVLIGFQHAIFLFSHSNQMELFTLLLCSGFFFSVNALGFHWWVYCFLSLKMQADFDDLRQVSETPFVLSFRSWGQWHFFFHRLLQFVLTKFFNFSVFLWVSERKPKWVLANL